MPSNNVFPLICQPCVNILQTAKTKLESCQFLGLEQHKKSLKAPSFPLSPQADFNELRLKGNNGHDMWSPKQEHFPEENKPLNEHR